MCSRFALLVLFVMSGCSKTHSLCGRNGTKIGNSSATACMYSAAVVVETGFECPDELPFLIDVGHDAFVCFAEAIEAEELPASICDALPRGCNAEGDVDGGLLVDAGMFDGEIPDAIITDTITTDTSTIDGAIVEMCGDGGTGESPVESTQTVAFHFTGSAFVAVEGHLCEGFTIDEWTGSDWTPLKKQLPFDCGCECPRPADPQVTLYNRVTGVEGPGSTHSWDARALALWTECDDCFDMGFVERLNSALQPLAAGHYRATFAVDNEPAPESCTDLDDGTVQCDANSFTDDDVFPWETLRLCEGDRTVQVEFDLPASGDVTVEVDTTAP